MNITTLSRATVLALSIAAVGLTGLSAAPARAAAPMVKKSAPGYYRMMLGDFEITALSDGVFQAPVDKLLNNATPSAVQEALAKSFMTTPMDMSVNGFLVNTGSKLILIDSGAGSFFGPTLGRLQANLRAAGYAPEQVDEIYITHMHLDHVGGLVGGAERFFPNAIVRADSKEAGFYLSPAKMDEALATGTDEAKTQFRGATAVLSPYVKAGKFKPFEGDTALTAGIKTMSSYGHTPGHTTYVVESKGQTMIFWGDVMHVAPVQFADPSITILWDTDNKVARAARQKVFAEAAQDGHMIGAAHVSFPGLGHMRSEGKGYVWVPVNYSPL